MMAYSQGMSKPAYHDPGCFEVSIENKTVGTFNDVELPSSEPQTIVADVAPPMKGSTLVLTRHYHPERATEMEQWFENVREGKYDRKDLTVFLTDKCRDSLVIAKYPDAWTMSAKVSEDQSAVKEDQVRMEILNTDLMPTDNSADK